MKRVLIRWASLAVAVAMTACTVSETGAPPLTGPSGSSNGTTTPFSPTARFIVTPTSGVANSPVAFDASSSCTVFVELNSTEACPDTAGTIVSYVWNFGDGTGANGISVSHSFALQRTYNVTLTVTNDRGLSNIASKGVTIGAGALPTATFTISPTNPVIGQDVFVNGNGSLAGGGHVITSYSWDFGDGSKKTGLTAQHDYGSSGTYTISLTVTDEAGQIGNSSKTVTVGTGAPTAAFAFAVTNPATHTVTFDGSASTAVGGAIISTYIWSFGDGSSGSGAVTSRSYSITGATTFTVTLTVTDNLGRSGVTSQSITVP
jgi:PKD repeat protein